MTTQNAQELTQTPAMAPKWGRGIPLLTEKRAAIKAAINEQETAGKRWQKSQLARTHGISRVTLYALMRELMAENRVARKKAKGGQS